MEKWQGKRSYSADGKVDVTLWRQNGESIYFGRCDYETARALSKYGVIVYR